MLSSDASLISGKVSVPQILTLGEHPGRFVDRMENGGSLGLPDLRLGATFSTWTSDTVERMSNAGRENTMSMFSPTVQPKGLAPQRFDSGLI